MIIIVGICNTIINYSLNMNEAFVELNGVRSKVLTWGRWIEEPPSNTNEIIIFIPGNPGIPGFYRLFAKTLHEKTQIPVWCLSHAGHNFADETLTQFPQFEGNKDLYGLKGQVDHKIEFFKKYVPKDAIVYLIAHSIGSYMTLEILEHPDVKPKVRKAYLLFPAIEHMSETSHGKFLNNFVRPIVWLILILTWVFTVLPICVANFLLYIYMFIANVPRDLHTENIRELLKPGVLRRVFFLGIEEMNLVKQRNNDVIKRNVDKIKVYYGRTDGWTPQQFYDGILKEISNVDVQLTDINHSFVFQKSVDVANIVADWIECRK